MTAACGPRWKKEMAEPRLILGVDGGGTKTAARIAALSADGEVTELGDAVGGPGNLRAVGPSAGKANLDAVIDQALADAGVGAASMSCAVLALAGSRQPEIRQLIREWADERQLARDVLVVHDIDPVLAAAEKGGAALALIVGTGTVAGGTTGDGARFVRGGWGYWFGDEGSGFDLGRRGLAAVASAVDGTGPDTALKERILEHLDINEARLILERLEAQGDVRREIAACARVVLAVADEGDETARGICRQAAEAAAALLHAAARELEGRHRSGEAPESPPELGLAGGVVTANTAFRTTMLTRLRELGTTTAEPALIHEPVLGCLSIAARRLTAGRRGV